MKLKNNALALPGGRALYIGNSSDSEFLQKVLARHGVSNPQIVQSLSGKPYLADSQLFFNKSDSHGVTTIAVSDREVGVDIEKITFRPRVVTRAFTENERSALENSGNREESRHILANPHATSCSIPTDPRATSCSIPTDPHATSCSIPTDPRAELFTRIWTMKEAYLKMLGTGISYGLKNIDVTTFASWFNSPIISISSISTFPASDSSANASLITDDHGSFLSLKIPAEFAIIRYKDYLISLVEQISDDE